MGAVKRSILKRRKRAKRTARIAILSALVLLILTVGSVFFIRFRNIAHIRSKIAVQLDRQEELIQINNELARLLSRKDDPGYIEYLAKKELGLIKPGEEKYIIVEP